MPRPELVVAGSQTQELLKQVIETFPGLPIVGTVYFTEPDLPQNGPDKELEEIYRQRRIVRGASSLLDYTHNPDFTAVLSTELPMIPGQFAQMAAYRRLRQGDWASEEGWRFGWSHRDDRNFPFLRDIVLPEQLAMGQIIRRGIFWIDEALDYLKNMLSMDSGLKFEQKTAGDVTIAVVALKRGLYTPASHYDKYRQWFNELKEQYETVASDNNELSTAS